MNVRMASTGEPWPEVLVGRQPILDRNLRIAGYELLFRSGPENRALITDPTGAKSASSGWLEAAPPG
jgi:hypothetical protein